MHFMQSKAGCKPCATFIALSQADCHIPTRVVRINRVSVSVSKSTTQI